MTCIIFKATIHALSSPIHISSVLSQNERCPSPSTGGSCFSLGACAEQRALTLTPTPDAPFCFLPRPPHRSLTPSLSSASPFAFRSSHAPLHTHLAPTLLIWALSKAPCPGLGPSRASLRPKASGRCSSHSNPTLPAPSSPLSLRPPSATYPPSPPPPRPTHTLTFPLPSLTFSHQENPHVLLHRSAPSPPPPPGPRSHQDCREGRKPRPADTDPLALPPTTSDSRRRIATFPSLFLRPDEKTRAARCIDFRLPVGNAAIGC